MSAREKDSVAGSEDDAEVEDEELTVEGLGLVVGGWHPAPPTHDSLGESSPPGGT